MSQQNPNNERSYKLDYANAVLSMNRALWGKVSPALRAAKIKWDEKMVHLYCRRLEKWNLNDKILSSDCRVEGEANLNKVSETEQGSQNSKSYRSNSTFQADGSIYFYYDGEISEEDHESAECVATEVIADFPEHKLEVDILRWDYPRPIPQEGLKTVYHRREQKPSFVI